MIVIAGCGGGGDDASSPPAACGTPTAAAELSAGERYFRLDGRSRFLLSRNLTGTEERMVSLIERAAAAGDKLMRVHLTHGRGMGIRADGSVDPTWAASWDRTLNAALRCGLYVIPVFGVWADFNDGTPNFGFQNWINNPLNTRGSPSDLYVEGSEVQKAWLAWLGALARRWQERQNILAWEVFSELDLITGATEAGAVAFVRRARAMLRDADSRQRPVTASTARDVWSMLPDAIDLVQLHLYFEQLDTVLIDRVRRQLAQSSKAVLIGESGLSAAAPEGNTLTTDPNAPITTRHASWAALVAGAMNGRALWWEDAYGQFHLPGPGFVERYPDIERGVAKLAGSRELSAYRPIDLVLPADVLGAAIGTETEGVGWVRSAGCTTPTWTCTLPRGGLRVTVRVPGTHPNWTVQMVNTLSGEPQGHAQDVDRSPAGVEIVLPPDFADDVAFTLNAR